MNNTSLNYKSFYYFIFHVLSLKQIANAGIDLKTVKFDPDP